MDAVLPGRDGSNQESRSVRLRVVARPGRTVAELPVRVGLQLAGAPKQVQNVVVEKTRG